MFPRQPEIDGSATMGGSAWGNRPLLGPCLALRTSGNRPRDMAAGLCSKFSPEGRARAGPQEIGRRVALTARGPEFAGWRPHPTGAGLAPHVKVGLSTCPSSGPSTRVAPAAAWTGRGSCFGRVFRHGPCSLNARHVRHRPAPVILSPPVRQETDPGPVAGFARRSRKSAARQRNRVGHRLPPPAALTFARQTGGIPSRLASKRSRSIRQRERSELWHGAGRCGKNGVDFVGNGRECGGRQEPVPISVTLGHEPNAHGHSPLF
jgi:hypothetical protein